MPLSLALLRQDLRVHLGMDSTDLGDSDADRLLNRSWWAIQSELGFHEKDKETLFTTTEGTREYPIPTDSDAVIRLVIQDPSFQYDYDPLIKIDNWNIFELRDDKDLGCPTHYARMDDKFILWPNPDKEYKVRVLYKATLSDIQTSGPDVPQEWHEVILWGAVSRGFLLRGDFARAAQFQNQQSIYLTTLQTQRSREHEDRGLSGFRILRRRYP